jgi:hypothetical protein
MDVISDRVYRKKTFNVKINTAQEAFINSELARDPTLAQKIKIEIVTMVSSL